MYRGEQVAFFLARGDVVSLEPKPFENVLHGVFAQHGDRKAEESVGEVVYTLIERSTRHWFKDAGRGVLLQNGKNTAEIEAEVDNSSKKKQKYISKSRKRGSILIAHCSNLQVPDLLGKIAQMTSNEMQMKLDMNGM